MRKVTLDPAVLVLVAVAIVILCPLHGTEGIKEKRASKRIRHVIANSTAMTSNESSNMESKMGQLQHQLIENAENLLPELRKASALFSALFYQNADVQKSLDQFRAELQNSRAERLDTKQSIEEESNRLEDLTRGVHFAVAALKVLDRDVDKLKRNSTKTSSNSRDLKQLHDNQYTPRDCLDIFESGNANSGLYLIKPHPKTEGFMVLCDMQTQNGGWTYIQRRQDGSQDFYLDYRSYKTGFGNLAGEFWLGLERIYQLTGNDVHELLIELQDDASNTTYARYAAFGLGGESEGYALKILGVYSGTAGDSLGYHAGGKFSTKDLDQDDWAEGSCAQAHGGAWWYRNCDTSNLNGKYYNGEVPAPFTYQGMYWNEFRGPQYSLKSARMLIRRRRDDGNDNFDRWIPEELRDEVH